MSPTSKPGLSLYFDRSASRRRRMVFFSPCTSTIFGGCSASTNCEVWSKSACAVSTQHIAVARSEDMLWWQGLAAQHTTERNGRGAALDVQRTTIQRLDLRRVLQEVVGKGALDGIACGTHNGGGNGSSAPHSARDIAPANTTLLFEYMHQRSNRRRDRPLCSMPGVARTTTGPPSSSKSRSDRRLEMCRNRNGLRSVEPWIREFMYWRYVWNTFKLSFANLEWK